MELYYVLSALIVLSSLFSYINARFIKMPSTVGVMMIAMIVSIALVIFGNLVPETQSRLTSFVKSINLHDLLMGAMLNFLLFAGALHIRINDLKEQRFAIIIFSSVSVVLSTFVVGILLYIILILFSFPVSFIECLIFGALISPTDPIAVLGVLKNAKVPRSIEIKVAGESLFNDGVAVVLFIALI
ncbi:MAG: cation:proton antiporter, partial [Crocinitomicaceae bacterium]